MGQLGRILAWTDGLGVHAGGGPETRRARALNLSALAALVLNTAFTVLFVFMDLSAIVPLPLLTNIAASLGYSAALFLSARRSLDAAMWAFAASAYLNLGVAGTFFGYDAGAWIYLLSLPVMGALIVPRGRRLPTLVFIGGGSLAFAAIPLTSGDIPVFLSDPSVRGPLFFAVAFTTALTISGIAFHYRAVAERAEAQSERLLLNILPGQIAERLKAGESPIADRIPEVTVLFCDIVGSTAMADRLTADDLVVSLDRLFIAIDEIAYSCGLEKIKTVGDEYFAVAGLHEPTDDHPYQAAQAALLIRDELHSHSVPGFGVMQMRFGLHTGPVVAGVIGTRKFSYDMWGDTINVASRMESTSEANMIQISGAVYERIKDRHPCHKRGEIAIKGKGTMTTYELDPNPSSP